jgi:acyl-CoA thioester hydrolase
MRKVNRGYFERGVGDPAPIEAEVRRRVLFGDADPMAVLWHGRYAALFEEASTELRRLCGLGYDEFHAGRLRAPVVQMHIDYHRPLRLDERAVVRARLVWTEAARLNIEYEVLRESGDVAATGFTVQLFIAEPSGEVCYVSPPMLTRCRERWRRGEFGRPA